MQMSPLHPDDRLSPGLYKDRLTVSIDVSSRLVCTEPATFIRRPVEVAASAAASMKSSCVVLALLLALNMASRLSFAGGATTTAHDHEGASASIPAILGRELRGFMARAGNIFRPAGAWRAANATGAAEAKNLRVVAASRRRRPATRKSSGGSGGGAGCVSAATCRKRRVICVKRCYGASRAATATASSLINHVPSRCVVRCKKCVPTC